MKSKKSAELEPKSKATQGNRLASETSTYLLQHAHNPVDWYPWGEEALKRAKDEDKPILLSIGYAACHWCHVMERESFEDKETAQMMNEHFICIKVDREERTDLDEIYMKAVQLMTGHGGWPMTVFLTPKLEPFFGGTYFPPVDRHGMPSFKRLLSGVTEAWRTKRAEIDESAKDIAKQLSSLDDFVDRARILEIQSDHKDEELVLAASQKVLASFDERYGGWGGAPKFPHSFSISLGMRCFSHWCRQKASLKESFAEMVTKTLDSMAAGGIHDQIGGGFARYSVDRQWLVPHFEKMLYDNALLCQSYLDGYLLFGKEYWKMVAEDTLDFVERELGTKNGGFYSSLDADSEGVEGKYYVWTFDEIHSLLGSEAELFSAIFGVSKQGNFEHGTNILHLTDTPENLAARHHMSMEELWHKLKPLKEKLLLERNKRIKPTRDEKVLTSWNSLMASAFVSGYQVTGHDKYLDTAKTTVNFILSEMSSHGKLKRTWGRGKSKLNGYLDDYTYFTQTLLDLAAIDPEAKWLDKAIGFAETTMKHFGDENGGLYYTADDHESLLSRPRSHFDGSQPSGTSVAILNFIRLGRITGDSQYRLRAEKLLANYKPFFAKMPDQFANMICALDMWLLPSPDIVVTLPEGSPAGKDLLFAVHRHFLPNKVVVAKGISPGSKKEAGATGKKELLLLEDKGLVAGKPAVFLCQNFACERPITDVAELPKKLKQ